MDVFLLQVQRKGCRVSEFRPENSKLLLIDGISAQVQAGSCLTPQC